MYQISTYQMHSLLNVFPQVVSWETKAADNVDDLLEQFLGIRDLELGMYQITTIFYLLVFSSPRQPHNWWTFAKARSSWTTLPCPLMSTWESLSSLVNLSLTSGRPLAVQRAPPSCDHATQCWYHCSPVTTYTKHHFTMALPPHLSTLTVVSVWRHLPPSVSLNLSPPISHNVNAFIL